MAYPNWNNFRTVPPRFDFGVVFQEDASSDYEDINFDDDIPICNEVSFEESFNWDNEIEVCSTSNDVQHEPRKNTNEQISIDKKENNIENEITSNNWDDDDISICDEVSFEESFNWDDEIEVCSNDVQHENTNEQRRFSEVTDEHILQSITNRVPLKTRKSTQWGNNTWNSWRKWKNSLPSTTDKIKPIRECSPAELGRWLSKFVYEVRKKDGDEYPYKSLYNICCAIMRQYNDTSDGQYREAIKIFDRNDPNFFLFYKAIDLKIGYLQRRGIGTESQQADLISVEDVNTLWETDTINMESSQGLSYGVYFYNNICFGMRSGDEHRELETSQYKFVKEDGYGKMMFNGRLNKNNQGGL